jgi:DNA polymerase III sliding clamp (beta) subunit (PCNA family)
MSVFRGSVEAQVKRTGATTLPAGRLLSIVRALPTSEIYFDVDRLAITPADCATDAPDMLKQTTVSFVIPRYVIHVRTNPAIKASCSIS